MKWVKHKAYRHDMRNAIRILVRRPAEKRPLGRLGVGRKGILKLNVEE
jgi:hypothetical protein